MPLRFGSLHDAGLRGVGGDALVVGADATRDRLGRELRLVTDVRARIAVPCRSCRRRGGDAAPHRPASSSVSAWELAFCAFWNAVAAVRSSVSSWSPAIASMPPAESICLRFAFSRTACAS